MVIKKAPEKRVIKNLMNKSITRFPAHKSIESRIFLESPLEKDYCYHLEFDDEVKFYEPQPLGFTYWLDGKMHGYTPDFNVHFEKHSCYYEIKYLVDVYKDKYFHSWFSAARASALEQGKDLILVTDEWITRQYRYENLCLLYKSVNCELDRAYAVTVHQSLKQAPTLTIANLLREESRGTDLMAIHKLLWMKQLKADLDSEILGIHSHVQWQDLL